MSLRSPHLHYNGPNHYLDPPLQSLNPTHSARQRLWGSKTLAQISVVENGTWGDIHSHPVQWAWQKVGDRVVVKAYKECCSRSPLGANSRAEIDRAVPT